VVAVEVVMAAVAVDVTAVAVVAVEETVLQMPFAAEADGT
jgi:hypothetical protein